MLGAQKDVAEEQRTMGIAKLLGGAGVLIATALLGGTLIASALAAPGGTVTVTSTYPRGPWHAGDGEYCEVFLDTFAAELGVSLEDLLPAGKTAAIAAIEAAVEAGDLDEDRADAMTERIEELEQAGCGMGFRLGFARGKAIGEVHGLLRIDLLEAVADALGMESAELIDRLADDVSIEDVAEAEGADYEAVKAAVLEAVRADLDAAVAEGLNQERADSILERIATWLDEGGERRMGVGGGPGRAHRGGPWHAGPWH
jgi:hypothetical protein